MKILNNKKIVSNLTTVGVVVFLIMTIMWQNVSIEGSSMEPTYHNNDKAIKSNIVGKLWFSDYHFGDIAVFRNDNDYLIKRVIGVPGDTIKIKDKILTINGDVIDEKYLDHRLYKKSVDIDEVTLENDEFFLMGDNRDNSWDSRDIGIINRAKMEGRVRKYDENYKFIQKEGSN